MCLKSLLITNKRNVTIAVKCRFRCKGVSSVFLTGRSADSRNVNLEGIHLYIGYNCRSTDMLTFSEAPNLPAACAGGTRGLINCLRFNGPVSFIHRHPRTIMRYTRLSYSRATRFLVGTVVGHYSDESTFPTLTLGF